MSNGNLNQPAVNPSTPKPPATTEGPGSGYVSGLLIALVSMYLVTVMAVGLYAIIKLWPHPTAAGTPPVTPPASTSTAKTDDDKTTAGSIKDAITKPTQTDITARQTSLCPQGDPACYVCVAHEMQLQYESQRRNDPQCTSIFRRYHVIWQEERLLLLVLLAGAVGALLHAIRSLMAHVGNRNFVTSWLAFYFLSPFAGAALAFVSYIAIRGGFFSSTATTADANPFMFVALGAFSGLFSQQVLEKLRKIAETAFDKAPTARDSLQERKPAAPTPPLVDGKDAEGDVDGCDVAAAPGAATPDEKLPAAEGGVQ